MFLYKYILFYSLIMLFCLGCRNRKDSSDMSITFPSQTLVDTTLLHEHILPVLFVNEKRYDFGTIRKNRKPQLEIDFPFTNEGHSPLIILDAKVSCNCLSVQYPPEPVMPSQKGIIKVFIDTKNQIGQFDNLLL